MTITKQKNNTLVRVVSCIECGTKFKSNHSQSKYCSDQCRQIGNRRSWNKYSCANKNKRREYSKQHYNNSKIERIAQIKLYKQTPAGKKATRKADINSRKNNPQKYKARQEVLVAKRCGFITSMPCYICGNIKTEAHHINYNKPLNIIWLCTSHHKKLHEIIKNNNYKSEVTK